VLALAFAPAAVFAERRMQPDTLERAAEWVLANTTAEDRIVTIPTVDLPLLHSEEAIADNSQRPWASNWIQYQMKLGPGDFAGPRRTILVIPPGSRAADAARAIDEDPVAYFRDQRARFVVISHDDETPLIRKARQALRETAELLARFSPEREDQGGGTAFGPRHLAPVLVRPFFLRVAEARCMGPTLEIYRVGTDPR
jgi:hypothetical protein